MTIRPAVPGDVDEIVRLWLSFIKSGAYPVLADATEATLEHLVLGLLAVGRRSCALVAEDRGGQLVGGLALVEANHPVTGALYADDVVWGVLPAFRSTLVGPQLHAAGELWAQARGGRFIRMTAPLTTPEAESFAAFYRARGYRAIETTFVKWLEAA